MPDLLHATAAAMATEMRNRSLRIQPRPSNLDHPPPRSTTACQRCRDQKLKCSREQPICSRCQRFRVACVYPRPPNRRGRKIQRTPRLARRAFDGSRERPLSERSVDESMSLVYEAQEPGPPSSLPSNNLIPSQNNHNNPASSPNNARTGNGTTSLHRATSAPAEEATRSLTSCLVDGVESMNDAFQTYPSQLRNISSITKGWTSDADQLPLPPRALGLSLLEVYFSRIYNASLLFCKPVLFQQYLDGKLPRVLLKGIFALATLFLHPPNGDGNEDATDESELKVLGGYHSCGLPWARSAMQEAMSLAVESPSLMVFQALGCISLYWFGIGEPHSGNLGLALAYRACHLLGYNKKIRNGYEKSDLSLESELGRRCFWACWVSTCIIMEPEAYIRSAWQEAAMLPLPALISYTPGGCEIVLNEKMDQNWCSSFVEPRIGTNHPPVAAAFVKMIGVWAKVQLLVNDCSASSTAQNLDSVQKLSNLATSIFETTVSSRQQTGDADPASEDKILILFFEALYHQCLITLHSIIVPLFSSTSTEPTTDLDVVKNSADKITYHADMFERLLAPYLYGKDDVTILPPLVSYGAFITGIVFLAIEISHREEASHVRPAGAYTAGNRLSAVKAILRLLDTLRVYWRALQRPWERLNAALQVDLSTYRRRCKTATQQSNLSATHVPRNYERNSPDSIVPPRSTPTNPIDAQQPGTLETANLATRPSSEQARPWLDQNTIDPYAFPQTPLTIRDDGYDFERPGETGTRVSFPAQNSMPLDDPWYNLSFAEAGIEEFAGTDPSTLFQQGWRIFS